MCKFFTTLLQYVVIPLLLQLSMYLQASHASHQSLGASCLVPHRKVSRHAHPVVSLLMAVYSCHGTKIFNTEETQKMALTQSHRADTGSPECFARGLHTLVTR